MVKNLKEANSYIAYLAMLTTLLHHHYDKLKLVVNLAINTLIETQREEIYQ